MDTCTHVHIRGIKMQGQVVVDRSGLLRIPAEASQFVTVQDAIALISLLEGGPQKHLGDAILAAA